MKTKKILFILMASSLIIPQFGISQTENKQATAAFSSGESWRPINKFDEPKNNIQTSNNIAVAAPLTNVLNGVSFYSKNSECNAEKVVILKLINSNNYDVQISWQMSPTSPKVDVIVSALKDYEGSCTTDDKNKAKLVIIKPSESKKGEAMKYALSHISVAEVK